jgi:hypothetical protein
VFVAASQDIAKLKAAEDSHQCQEHSAVLIQPFSNPQM